MLVESEAVEPVAVEDSVLVCVLPCLAGLSEKWT